MSVNYRYHQWLLEYSSIINHECKKQKKVELIAAMSAMINIIKTNNKRKKRLWVSKIFTERQRHGLYHATLPNIRLEDLRFKNFTRMTTTQFEDLLLIIGHNLQKLYVVREPINEEQRLLVTLRYL